jgi:ribonuclease R
MPRRPVPGLPTPDQIIAFIETTPTPVGKREIARAFGLAAQDKIALKALLKSMADDGLIDSSKGKALHKAGGVPRVTVLRVTGIEGGSAYAAPEAWPDGTPRPRIRIVEGKRHAALKIGDRILARTEETGRGQTAHVMKKLAATSEAMLGVVRRDASGWWLVPTDKRLRHDLKLTDVGEADAGDLVLVEPSGRGARAAGRVVDVLGDPMAPRSFSLIAIHEKGIPHEFSAAARAEAEGAAHQPLGEREDLTALPFITIDPADARDHDDAVWAAADDAAANKDGWRAIVAIADVSYYVCTGTALDNEARARGNSVYFPDRVVSMLPEALSNEACSLKAGTDKAVLACHLVIAADGTVRQFRFTRAKIRCLENLAYETAQAAIDGTVEHALTASVLAPLWSAWRALKTARDRREPLALLLPERRVIIDEAGRIAGIRVRQPLDAHQLIEDFMIAANVAAAKALEAKKSPLIYRVHEPPSREKLLALKDFAATLGKSLALGQVIQPATFNRLLAGIEDEAILEQLSQQVLRTQTQAYYSERHAGHFGLALGSYAHFTSPIRRYADLVVHRALVAAHKLGSGGLSDEEAARIARTAEHISMTERRAMEAERDTLDRYVAAYLAERVGEIVRARVTGVTRFGLFAQVEEIGGDGLIPMSQLGPERFHFDEAAQTIEGLSSGRVFKLGDRHDVRIADANPISGGLRFELVDAGPAARPLRAPRPRAGKPRRPPLPRGARNNRRKR